MPLSTSRGERRQQRAMRRLTLIVRTLFVWLLFVAPIGLTRAFGEPATNEFDTLPETRRIDRLEKSLESVIAENERLGAENARLAEDIRQLQQQSPFQPSVESTSSDWTTVPAASSGNLKANTAPEYRVGYDGGFVIFPEDDDESPFSLKINSQTTFRYSGFLSETSEWTDSAGNVTPLVSSSNFLIPRGRLILSGKALLPDLTYLVNIDYNSATSNPIGFRAYALNYQFSRAFTLSVGQNKVPGTREWIGSSFVAQEGPDRTMATTFFRPSLSQGIWCTGEPADGWFYHAMISNGFNTLNLRPSQLDNRACWSGSTWWEPWGAFGPGYSDLEAHEQPAVRLGGSYTFSMEQGSQSNNNAPENSSIRLSDGTLITQQGAFAPGVTLTQFNISLLALDLAFKYRGISLSTEGYYQNLLGLEGNGPIPRSSTQAYGGFVQGGYFVIPQEVELYTRTSVVTGDYGTGNEYAGGFNWFILPGKNNLRFTADTAWLHNSPADQNRTGFVAGQTGLLIRTQITASF